MATKLSKKRALSNEGTHSTPGISRQQAAVKRLNTELAKGRQLAQTALLKKMEKNPDVILRFSDNKELPGHSQILAQWSEVLGEASELALKDGGKVPMEGTKSEDWLKIAAFMYPTEQQAKVTWENLEALLVLGTKYDMKHISSRADEFLDSNIRDLTGHYAEAPNFVWKWIKFLDAPSSETLDPFHLDSYIWKAATAFKSTCSLKNMNGLSSSTLAKVAAALADTWDKTCPVCEEVQILGFPRRDCDNCGAHWVQFAERSMVG